MTTKQKEFILFEIKWIKKHIEELKNFINEDEKFVSKWKSSNDGLIPIQIQQLFENKVKLKMKEASLEVLQELDK